MKFPFSTSALFAAAVFATAAAAQTPTTTPTATTTPSLIICTTVNPTIDILATKVTDKSPIASADYKKIKDAMTTASKGYGADTPQALTTRERFLARVMDLETRAQTAMFAALELDILKDQAIDADLDFALARLRAHATSGTAPKTDWDAIYSALNARADAAKSWNPEIDSIMGRFRTEIEGLMARAKASQLKESDFVTAVDISTECRLSIVLTRLEHRGLALKGVVEPDYADVVSGVKRIDGDTAELVKKVQAKLDEIMTAVKNGRISKDKYAELRDMIMTRARAAASAK